MRGSGPGALAAVGRARLARGGQRVWHYWMPAYPMAPGTGGLDRLADHDRVAGEARATWRERLASASPLATPDSLVNAAYRAALVTLWLCQERAGSEWAPIGNPFQYRDVWIHDGARVVRALAVAGCTDLSRSDAWTLTRFQLPSGVLISQHGQLDGTGEALWALAQAASLPPSREWAARTLPVVRRALEWIEVQRLLRPPARHALRRTAHPTAIGAAKLTRASGRQRRGDRAISCGAALAQLGGDPALARMADSLATDSPSPRSSFAAEPRRAALVAGKEGAA
jgi:hypothetical protein